MKKILIFIIILFHQSFPSFGNPNGKGILCADKNFLSYLEKRSDIDKIPNVKGFSFLGNKVTFNYLDRKSDDIVMLSSSSVDFKTTNNSIEWSGSGDVKWELNRKSLILKELFKTTLKFEYKCDVYSKDEYTEKMKELKDWVQQSIDEKLKSLDNKI